MTQLKLNVLIACEESQTECAAFRELGHNAYSCDIQMPKRSGHPDWHIIGNVTPFLEGRTTFRTMDCKQHRVPRWDLIIAHPPCTYLCKVSSIQLYKGIQTAMIVDGKEIVANEERVRAMQDARRFFFKCLAASAPYVAVENPIPLALANLPRPSCFVQPYWFGHPYSKKTLLWLKNLPPLMPTILVGRYKEYVRASRGKYRSRSFSGIAKAMADQWSACIIQDISR